MRMTGLTHVKREILEHINYSHRLAFYRREAAYAGGEIQHDEMERADRQLAVAIAYAHHIGLGDMEFVRKRGAYIQRSGYKLEG